MTLKRYPAQLSLTAWMNFVGAAQSAVFTVIIQHKPSDWAIGINIDLWSTIYGVSIIIYHLLLEVISPLYMSIIYITIHYITQNTIEL